MLDADLAELYGVATKRLNEQVRRNIERFPLDFMFQLENQELAILRLEILAKNLSYMSRATPFAFTENGVAMLSSVLNSPQAIQINIAIMRIFTKLRKNSVEENLFERVCTLENETEKSFIVVFRELGQVKDLIKTKLPERKRKIGINEKTKWES